MGLPHFAQAERPLWLHVDLAVFDRRDERLQFFAVDVA